MGEDLEQLKQRIPLLEYLQRHHWTGHRARARSEFVGLCPLHEESHPSRRLYSGRRQPEQMALDPTRGRTPISRRLPSSLNRAWW